MSTDPLATYNVVWTTPSKDHNGSMPIGNGDIGMNVWVEQDGDLLLLLSKTDAWSENHRLLKLGRVRVKLSPNPFVEGAPFKQTLRLRQGEIAISAGEGDEEVRIRIWVDANRPVIRLEADSESPFEMKAEMEVWRTARRELEGEEVNSAYGLHQGPSAIYVYPDTILAAQDRIAWFHRNEKSIWEDNLKYQGMASWISQSTDPLLHRTFGGCIQGSGLVNDGPTTLTSQAPRNHFALSIHPLCAQVETVEAWLKKLDKTIADNDSHQLDRDRKLHQAWWNEFWDRSWIRITGFPDAEVLTRAYTLQRWISACAGRGVYPIKFNGTLFTVEGGGFDADYRQWGGPYWWQNTRLLYWPMLASGDVDMMLPLFRMYKDMLPLAEHRTQTWFGHKGSFVVETMYFWGMYNNSNYGWERDENMPVGEVANPYVHRYYTSSPELMAMMLDFYDYTGDEKFLRELLLPTCDSLLTFWNEHYPLDETGHMEMYPAQSLETLHDAKNPAPDIAGLRWVLGKLLDLPEGMVGTQRRTFWVDLLKKVPPLPMAEADGKKHLLAAEEAFGERANFENPELYAVFPFRLYGVGKPGLDIGRRTFDRREQQGNSGWFQDDTQAAFLGLAETAAAYIVDRAKNKHAESRFPAFWGPNFDWVPDQDHGGNLLMGLQAMILQADDGKIRLLPAWPKNWDLDFKLHAPHGTTVEGRVRNGKLVDMSVVPESRRKDVIVMEAQ
ncbi:MAG: hypothetical protein HQ559_16790 [Lentisphaerae bacterium]|nr:hypothetical protein [Lentisphaerota bacterium]